MIQHLPSKCKVLSSNPSIVKKIQALNQAPWYILIIPALRRLRQEDLELEASQAT
jgi:hypothetical protein